MCKKVVQNQKIEADFDANTQSVSRCDDTTHTEVTLGEDRVFVCLQFSIHFFSVTVCDSCV